MANCKPTDREVLKIIQHWLSNYSPRAWDNDLYDATVKVPVLEIWNEYRRIERHLGKEAKP